MRVRRRNPKNADASLGPIGRALTDELGVTAAVAARRRRQGGFTLIELLIATALGVMVMGALTSVVLTSMQAANTATARVEASSQVRNFQFTAYDDFVLARAPVPSGCGTPTSPCTTQDLLLQGHKVPNEVGGVAAPYTVRYVWDSSRHVVTRYAGTSSRVTATNVTAYSWYIESSGANPSVVVSVTVTIAFYNSSYSDSQTLRFYPRLTASPTP
jgi:prepilin-type N-terminal cleavage/methylation domain-containing protein